MAVPVKNIENFEVGNPNDIYNVSGDNNNTLYNNNTFYDNTLPDLGGEGGGGTTIQPTTTNTFIFNVSSNQKSFESLVNGEKVGDSKRIRISRESLAEENKKIEIKKEGYFTDEYYLIEMVDDGVPIIDNPKFNQPLGINTKDVVLTYYKGGETVGRPLVIGGNVSTNLVFNLTQRSVDVIEEPSTLKVSFKISGKGTPVSILKNGNKSAEFFPTIGVSEYEDISGTKYIIRSSNSSLHRITKISWNNEELSAKDGESLELDITLNDNYIFSIETEEVFQGTPAKDPKIELVKTDARKYNINSKTGVPLMFKKNSDVEAITVIVGEDVLEFDDLDKGDLCGITIPHSVFKNIGKYNVKIFPFSFDDYENQVRPAEPADTIETKEVVKKNIVKEEVVIETPKPKDIYNPYNPTVGVGGNRPIIIDSIEQELKRRERASGGVEDNSFVNRPVDNRNIK